MRARIIIIIRIKKGGTKFYQPSTNHFLYRVSSILIARKIGYIKTTEGEMSEKVGETMSFRVSCFTRVYLWRLFTALFTSTFVALSLSFFLLLLLFIQSSLAVLLMPLTAVPATDEE